MIRSPFRPAHDVAPAPLPTPEEKQSGAPLRVSAPNHWSRYFNVALGAALVLNFITVLLMKLVPYLMGPDVFDDSYMAVRYVDNLLHLGKLAWNPSVGPVYGQTSILFMFIVLPFRLLQSSNATATVILASSFCGVAFLAMVFWMMAKNVGATKSDAIKLGIVLLLLIGQGSDRLAAMFVSGMDTTFAMSYLALLIITAANLIYNPIKCNAIALGVMSGFAFLARPDLSLYAFFVGAAVLLTPEVSKMLSLRAAAIAVVGLIASLIACRFYFGSFLPLPFFAKSTHIYHSIVYREYSVFPGAELLSFVGSFRFLIFPIPFALVMCWRKLSRLDWAILVATVLFISYYRFFVLQIMPYNSRFYFPVLPAIVYLSGRSLVLLFGRLSAKRQIFVVEDILPALGIMCAVFYVWEFLNPYAFWMCIGISVLAIVIGVRKLTPWELLAGVLLIPYISICLTQFNGMDPRIYVFPLPIIFYLGYVALKRRVTLARKQINGRLVAVSALAGCFALVGGSVALMWPRFQSFQTACQNSNINPVNHYLYGYTWQWPQLDKVSALPDDEVIAVADVGLPGIFNEKKIIVDLDSLQSNDVGKHGFDPSVMFAHYTPDVIYEPWEGQIDLNANLFYRKNYEFFPPKTLHPTSLLGAAVYKKSRYYNQLHAMFVARQKDTAATAPDLGFDERVRYESLLDPLVSDMQAHR